MLGEYARTQSFSALATARRAFLIMRTLLIARGALNLGFGLFFLAVSAADPAQNFRQGGFYLTTDGLVALLTAGMVLRGQYPGWLTALASVDALARLLLGLWFLF